MYVYFAVMYMILQTVTRTMALTLEQALKIFPMIGAAQSAVLKKTILKKNK